MNLQFRHLDTSAVRNSHEKQTTLDKKYNVNLHKRKQA